MKSPAIEVEGSWEEVQQQDTFRGKRVRVTSVPEGSEDPALRKSTGADLLKHAKGWTGDDFEECLQAVYQSRTRF